MNYVIKNTVVSILSGLPVCMLAQQSLDSIQYLQEVNVIASHYSEVIPAQRLSGKELETLNTFSVADAIRYFAGVQIKDYGGIAGLKTVNIRSMGTNHMGVFYDGIQLGNAQNGQVDLGKYSLDNIEEISLYNGQKSEILQSAREFGSSGSIYINTRIPKFTDGKTTNIKASFKTTSFERMNGFSLNLCNPSILFEHKINDKLSMTLSSEWINSDGKYKFRYRRVNVLGELAYDTTAIRQNSDINVSRIETGLNGIIDDSTTWQLRGYVYNSERGVPGAIVNNVFRSGERLWDTNSFLQGSLRKRFSNKITLLSKAKYASDYTHYMNYDIKLVSVDNIFRQKELYVTTAAHYPITREWEASVAYDFQWNTLYANLIDFAYPTRYTHMASLATAFSWWKIKLQASLFGTYVDDRTRITASAEPKKELKPAVFVSYKPFDQSDFSLRAFYKQMFRMPTFNDLYYTDMGNTALKPEKTTQYNVGLAFDKIFLSSFYKKAGITVDAYYNQVKNKIIAYPKGQQFRWTTLNLGYVEIKGADVSQTNEFNFGKVIINAKLQYTYQTAVDLTDPTDNYYGDQIPYIPWHSGSAIFNADYKGWLFNYSFIYVGERYNQQENIRYNHTQPWYTSDLSLVKKIQISAGLLKVVLEVNNVFDQDYDVVLNYPMPMRNYKMGVSLDF